MSINIWRHGAVPRSGPAATSAAGLPYWFSEFLADRAVRKPSPHNRRTDRGPAGHRGQQGQLARGVRRLRRHPASDKTCMPGCLSWNPGPVAFSRDDNRFGRHLIPDDACPRRRCTPIDYDPSIGTERPAWCRTSPQTDVEWMFFRPVRLGGPDGSCTYLLCVCSPGTNARTPRCWPSRTAGGVASELVPGHTKRTGKSKYSPFLAQGC